MSEKRAFPPLGWNEIAFSLKTLLAAALALWIAFRLGLSRPFWSLVTVYVVSQPLAVAVTSKAVYRLFGTALGAALTLLAIPALANAPELLALALAAWVGVCLAISLLDRSPRSYIFMLAGYTAAIIGFTSLSNPAALFDIAVSRALEISLGILCAVTVSRVFFPRHAGPALAGRMEAWLEDAATWAEETLSASSHGPSIREGARHLAADTVEIATLISFLPYDTSSLRRARARLTLLDARMTAMIPLLLGAADRLEALRRGAASLSRELLPPLEGLARWMTKGRRALPSDGKRLRGQLSGISARFRGCQTWEDLLSLNLCHRLTEIAKVWEDCLILRQTIAGGTPAIPRRLRVAEGFARRPLPKLDAGLAWASGFAAFSGTLIACVFWLGTGWAEGAVAAQLTAIFCCIFAAFDNPLPILRLHTACVVGAAVIAAIFQFALLPRADGFFSLLLILSPFLFIGGLFIATPKWGFAAFAVCVNVCLFLALESTLTLDLPVFANGALAAIVASALAMIIISLFRAADAEEGARRLLKTLWDDLSRLTRQSGSASTTSLARRMTEHLGHLAPRILALAPSSKIHATDAMTDIRAGLNIADIRRFYRDANGEPRGLLEALGAHFRARLRDPSLRPGGELLAHVDRALDAVARPSASPPSQTRILLALAGLRRCLFPDAPAPDIFPTKEAMP